MKKRAGLADDPLFMTPKQVAAYRAGQTPQSNPNKTPSTKSNFSENRSGEQMVKRSSERVVERSSDQTTTRTGEQDYRLIVRHSYDFYQDQVYAIEDEVVKRSRQKGRATTKGEVMREIVDFYFAKRKK